MEIISGEEPKQTQPNSQNNNEAKPWGLEISQYNMLMHFSQFAGFIIPLGGFILPIVMWNVNKDLDSSIDQNGKNVLNWMISSIVYAMIFIPLIFIIIGIPLLVTLGICSTIFTIIGGIKASNGEVYRYPFSFTFLK